MIIKESNRVDYETEFDNFVGNLVTRANKDLDETAFFELCNELEFILSQYTDPNFYPDDIGDEYYYDNNLIDDREFITK